MEILLKLHRILAICGMLAPILYTAMWILGGFLDPTYNPIQQDVSSLVAVGAPNKALLDIFNISSTILLFLFYLGLHKGVNKGEGSVVGPLLFIVSSFIGILVALFFPLDEGGEMVTSTGMMHLPLVVTMGILTILGMFAIWYRLKADEEWKQFATFSLISAIVALALVIVSMMVIGGPIMGLVERIMVTAYQIYYFVIAYTVYQKN